MPYQKINGKWTQVGTPVLLNVQSQKQKQANEINKLLTIAQKGGVGKEAKQVAVKTPKLSFLQRLAEGVNLFNPTGALTRATKGEDVVSGYLRDIGLRARSAVTGQIPTRRIETGADLAQTMGVKNSIARFGIGFAADVLLDPSTYFGGALLKGAEKVAAAPLKLAVKGAEAVAPEAVAGIKQGLGTAKEALQRAVDARFGTSTGLAEDLAKAKFTRQDITEGIFKKQAEDIGTGITTKAQDEELGLLLRNQRRQLFTETKNLEDGLIKTYNDTFKPKVPLTSTEEAAQKLKTVTNPDEAGLLSRITNAYKEIRVQYDKVPIVLKKGLPEKEASIATKLLEQGRPVPLRFRDVILERRAQELAALGRQTGQAAVQSGRLSENTIANAYAPFIHKADDRQELTNFLVGVKHFGVGSEDYLKRFNAVLGENQVVKGQSEALAIRRAQVSTDIYAEKELKRLVGKYGQKFETPEAARKAGFVPITTRGTSTQMGKVIGYVSRDDARLLNAFIGTPEFATIDAIAKATGFDALTGLFKRAVTGLFAPFHIRNWVSGILQNYEMLGAHALSPKMMGTGGRIARGILRDDGVLAGRIARQKVAKGLVEEKTIELGGKTYKLSQLQKTIKERFFGGSQIIDVADATRFLADQGKVITDRSIKQTIKSLGTSAEGVPFRAARKVSEYIEIQQKSTAFVTALDLGKPMDEALDLARKAGFDYRELTGFESKVLRRLIPFYAFNRFNVVLQIQTLLKNPQRAGNIIKAFQDLGQMPTTEQRETLPEYLANGFGIQLSVDQYNNPVFISSFGTPVEAFAQLIDKNPILRVLSNMNPLLKTPIELGIGKDSFRKKDLKDVYDAREYSASPKFIKDFLQIHPVQKQRYKDGVPTGETYVQYVADPQRLLIARSLFTSRGITYLDQVFDGDLKGFAKAVQLLTGIKPTSVNLEISQAMQQRDTTRALQDLLVRYGAAKEFRTVYEPKGKFNPGLTKR